MKKYLFFSVISLFFTFGLYSQSTSQQKDSLMIKKIYDESLENGKAYDDLYDLCKNIGDRLAGSVGAKMAVKWSEKTLQKYNFDEVYLQSVKVPNWKRGTKEKAYIEDEAGNIQKVNLLAVGGSVGTDGIMEGEIVMFPTLEALMKAEENSLKDKIVFVAEKMNPTAVDVFDAYGTGYMIRGYSAVEAAKKGAKAVVIRSLSLSENDFPNTGTLAYDDEVKKIPSVALSTNDATKLEKP